ncbi:hypothetical protein PAPYR_3839 [Paratrimastix pyriformis]|uniref:Uncharacterized protein n=1 Tax=Paratrimastix pyriformis TaxID=342808 RepID=A0ABQ8ULQ4_9EUKA|nr:hypothetical protein PAPYR_3839 [Paratrimastix pyriformis]
MQYDQAILDTGILAHRYSEISHLLTQMQKGDGTDQVQRIAEIQRLVDNAIGLVQEIRALVLPPDTLT